MSHYGYASEGRAIPTCLRCGALVTNQPLHDQFHEEMESMTVLNVATAMNLLAVVNTLIEAGIDVPMEAEEVPQ